MSILVRSSLAVLSTLAALGCASSAHAQFCSNASLQGSYGYTVTGTVTAAFGPLIPGPFAAVGKINFDGFGHVTTVRTLSDNGFVLANDPGTGSYTINSDCTGSFNITVGPPNNLTKLTLNLVLDDNNELRAIVTNTGAVLVFEGRKQQALYL